MTVEPSGINLKNKRNLILNVSENCSINSNSTFNSESLNNKSLNNSKSNSSSPVVVYIEYKSSFKYSGKSTII